MREQVPVEKLVLGMFVVELDRPWLGTPFMIQGFVIESPAQIDEFRKVCRHVFVERSLSLGDQFIADVVEKKVAPERKRPEPSAHIYQDEKSAAGATDGGLLGSIGKIFKAAFSTAGVPPPVAPPPQSGAPREPVVTIYKDRPPRRRPSPESSAVREKGMSSEERRFLEQALDPDASVRVYAEQNAGGGMFGRLSRMFKVSAEDKKLAAGRPVEEVPVYVDQTTIEDELPLAQEAQVKVEGAVQSILDDIGKSKALELDQVNDAVGRMVESVVRNPDGMIWLTRLKSVDAYTYDHGINTAIYLIAFGRHLGLPEDQLQVIGTVGLMQDVGKIKLPRALLDKREKLSSAELKVFQSHVTHSLELVRSSKEATAPLLDTIAQHHERYDGSGYPQRLAGEDISLFGGMAGLADTYSALISARPYAQPLSVQQALHDLYNDRGVAFKSELVEQFIQCVGVFPVGSLVELNTGEVAVVVSQNRARRLKPRVMLVLDKNRQSYPSPTMLDLIVDPPTPTGASYRILRGLQAGIYEHDPQQTLNALMEAA